MDARIADENTQLREAMDRALSRLNSAIPGEIDAFDPATQTATVVPAIKMRTNVDGVTDHVDLPAIVNVPVMFPFASTAGFALTLPIRKGDPCLLVFSQRAIDNWHDHGGIQPPENDALGCRHHDLTDAFAIMAPVPLPNVLSNWEVNGAEIRNRARTSRLTVLDDRVVAQAGNTIITVLNDGTVSVVAPTSVTIDSPLSHFTGNVTVDGGITSTGTYGASGGKIQTPGDIESTGGDVKDSVRTMAADRAIYNGHTHADPQGGDVATPTGTM